MRCMERGRTGMSNGETRAITNHNVIQASVWSMHGEIV